MGQKVGGYRRNVPYGESTRRRGSKAERGKTSWRFDVNPKGRVGWDRGTSGRSEAAYGASVSEGRRLRTEVEEVRKVFGCESNGLGRKGTKERGYQVYGEYTYEDPSLQSPGKEVEATSGKKKKALKKRFSETDLSVARERVRRKYETVRKAKIHRQRRNLKERRKEKGLEADKKERGLVLGYSTKRSKPSGRTEAVALSGRLPTGQRRTKLLVRELEHGLNHMEVRRNRENLRTYHGKHPRYGRKTEKDADPQYGYYGYQLRVKGPLGGARRTMTYRIQKGTVPRGTKKARRTVASEHAKTKIGTLGVKVTYCYGRG